MSFNQPAPHLLDGDPLPEQRLQAIDGQGMLKWSKWIYPQIFLKTRYSLEINQKSLIVL